MSYTPGPWHYIDIDIGLSFRIFTSDKDIAETMGFWDKAEEEANARLISAAPDMLEALKDCFEYLEIANIGDHRKMKSYYAAKAAIAKATEKSHD